MDIHELDTGYAGTDQITPSRLLPCITMNALVYLSATWFGPALYFVHCCGSFSQTEPRQVTNHGGLSGHSDVRSNEICYRICHQKGRPGTPERPRIVIRPSVSGEFLSYFRSLVPVSLSGYRCCNHRLRCMTMRHWTTSFSAERTPERPLMG